MGQIHILSDDISGKIAAGEVVERPASVIKELIENSIDAGSTVITVQIKDGGISYMRVTDNGTGMQKEDAELCFVRHATSKIQTADDLDAIYTLGFRGEAMASIAAVSKVDIYTKQHDSEEGFHIRAESGIVYPGESCGTPSGTSITVQNLFFNTPARMKFLKKNTTEAGYIADIVSRFILSHPEISIKFINGNKEQYFSPGNNKLEDCVYTVYGKDYAKNIIKIDYAVNNIRVSGVIGKNIISRPNRTYQSFFINGRYVKSPLIARAVEEAYKNQIMIGKFPMAVINIEINPSMIDINVHPTKLEVKFSNESDIYSAVYFTVKNALYNTMTIPEMKISKGTDNERDQTNRTAEFIDNEKLSENNVTDENKPDDNILNNNNISAVKQAQNMISSYIKPKKNDVLLFEDISDDNKADENNPESDGQNISDRVEENSGDDKPKENNSKNISRDILNETEENYDGYETKENNSESGGQNISDKSKNQESEPFFDFSDNSKDGEKSIIDVYFERMKEYKKGRSLRQNVPIDLINDGSEDYSIIGQIFDTYIIIQKNDEVLFIDQHAAHERLRYEMLKKEAKNRSISSQILLMPVIISLNPGEYGIYKENEELFENLGFKIEEFGQNSIAVRESPVMLEESELSALMSELITYAGQSKKEVVSEKYDRMMYTIACKGAIKAKHKMSREEIKKLVDDVFAMENINTCPHGRPIMISMSQKQVEKEFKRIV